MHLGCVLLSAEQEFLESEDPPDQELACVSWYAHCSNPLTMLRRLLRPFDNAPPAPPTLSQCSAGSSSNLERSASKLDVGPIVLLKRMLVSRLG